MIPIFDMCSVQVLSNEAKHVPGLSEKDIFNCRCCTDHISLAGRSGLQLILVILVVDGTIALMINVGLKPTMQTSNLLSHRTRLSVFVQDVLV